MLSLNRLIKILLFQSLTVNCYQSWNFKVFWFFEFSCLIKGSLSDFTIYTGAILNCAGKDPVFWFLVGSGNRFLQTSKKPKLKSGNPVITSANKNKSKNFQLCCIFKTGFFSRKWKWLWFMKWTLDLTKHYILRFI